MKKVLYNVSLPNLFAINITHRLVENFDNEATLIIYDSDDILTDELEYKESMKRANLKISDIRSSGIFEKILVINSGLRFGAFDSSTVEEIEKKIIKNYDDFFTSYHVDLSDFSEIYTSGDWWEGSFKIYLSLKNLPVNVIENSKDAFFNFQYNNYRSLYEQILLKYSASFPNGLTDTPIILSNSMKSLNLYEDKSYSLFNYQEALNRLSDDDKDKISIFFNHYNLKVENSTTLLMMNNVRFHRKPTIISEHSNYIRFLLNRFDQNRDSFSSATDISMFRSQIALDFFSTNAENIHVKHHPRSWFGDSQISKWFGKKSKSLSPLPGDFYSNLDKKYDTAIHFASNVSNYMFKFSENNIVLGNDFYKTFLNYYKIVVVLNFILENTNCPVIYAKSPYTSQIKLLLKFFFKREDIIAEEYSQHYKNLENSFIISQNYVSEFNKAKNVFFLEESEEYLEPSKIRIIQIDKESIEINSLSLSDFEIVYFVSDNDEIQNNIKKFKFNFETKYSKIKLFSYSPSFEAQWQYIYQLNSFLNNKLLVNNKILIEKNRKKINEMDDFLNKITSSLDCLEAAKILNKVNDLDTYLDLLIKIKEEYLIAFSVKDTAGFLISEKSLRKIKLIGMTEFSNQTQIPFVGLKYADILLQKTGEANTNIDLTWDNNECMVYLKSQPYKSGNSASIQINESEYAVNIRGINIVVYDLKNDRLVDSVAFDMHHRDMPVYHC